MEEIVMSTENLSISEDVHNEILALEAIYDQQLVKKECSGGFQLELRLVPSDMDLESFHFSYKKFLFLMIQIVVIKEYPSESPEVRVLKQRGFSEEDLDLLHATLSSFLQENRDTPILFEIFQLVQDFLDQHEISKIPCSVCLSELCMADDDVFITECGHNFHRTCFLRYLSHKAEEAETQRAELLPHLVSTFDTRPVCPVCRSRLSSDFVPEGDVMGYAGGEDDCGAGCSKQSGSGVELDFDWTGWREKQKEMKEIFERQKRNGGIIDVEQEEKKFLVTEETRVVFPYKKEEEDKFKGVGKVDDSLSGTKDGVAESAAGNSRSPRQTHGRRGNFGVGKFHHYHHSHQNSRNGRWRRYGERRPPSSSGEYTGTEKSIRGRIAQKKKVGSSGKEEGSTSTANNNLQTLDHAANSNN